MHATSLVPAPSKALVRPDADDLVACREILRVGSKSFSAAARLLPRRLRAPAAAIYAFCRVADDAVDADVHGALGGAGQTFGPAPAAPALPPLSARARLALLDRRLDAIFAGTPRPDPVDRAFAEVVAATSLPRAVPDALLEGFLWDVEGRRYDELTQVVAYAVRAAGTVGVMIARLLGVTDPVVLARAVDLGVAMQLTNIARDVGEDARAGRLYLPRAWLVAEGVCPEAFLADPRPDPGVARVVLALLDVADGLYARADAGLAALPGDARPAMRAARLVYADIGTVIRRRGGETVARRAMTSAPRKLWRLLQALGSRFWSPRPLGDAVLPEARSLVIAAGTAR